MGELRDGPTNLKWKVGEGYLVEALSSGVELESKEKTWRLE